MSELAVPGSDLLAQPGISIADFRSEDEIAETGDRRDGKFYRYTPEIKLAVRVALAVGRPMLIFGPSGCGKSSLVFNLARLLRRRYYEFVVSSRSEARDLYYRFDAVRRLGEAQLGAAGAVEGHGNWGSSYPFIEPGSLWWVYSPSSARTRGSNGEVPNLRPAVDSGRWPPDYGDASDQNEFGVAPPAILLIDEIDKADPDFPNNLLVPLGSRQFMVEETGDLIRLDTKENAAQPPPLVIITSNRERELPAAFVRRCVVLEIPSFGDEDLLHLAKATFRRDDASSIETWRRIATILREIRQYEQVSPAEYLDSIRAIDMLAGDDPSKWKEIILSTSWTSNMAARADS